MSTSWSPTEMRPTRWLQHSNAAASASFWSDKTGVTKPNLVPWRFAYGESQYRTDRKRQKEFRSSIFSPTLLPGEESVDEVPPPDIPSIELLDRAAIVRLQLSAHSQPM